MAKSPKGGKEFQGAFALTLADLLDTIRRSRHKLAFRVKWDENKLGAIYFEEGRLVHAEFEDATGEEAFMQILAARNGTYEKIPRLTADVVSIEEDAGNLVGKALNPEEAPKDWTPPPAPDRGFQEEAWMKDWGRKTPGFRSAGIFRSDGIPVMNTGKEPIQNDAFCDLLKAAAGIKGEEEKVQGARVELKEDLYLICALSEGYFLAVNLDKGKVPHDIEGHLQSLCRALEKSLKEA